MMRALLLLAILLFEGQLATAATWLEPGEPLTEATMQMIVVDTLPAISSGHRLEVRLTRPALPMANRAKGRMRLELVSLDIDDRTGEIDGRLSARLESGEQSMLRVNGRVVETAPVIAPTRSLRRGERIEFSDVSTTWHEVGRLREGVAVSAEAVVGLEAGRSLPRGRPIHLDDLRRPRLVYKGEVVEVRYLAQGIELIAAGEALADAGLGEIVRLTNSDSGKRFRARVVARKQAVIDGTVTGGASSR